MVKAVIFDLDDTLISEKHYIRSAYNHIAKVLGSKTKIGEELIFSNLIELFQHSPKNVFNRFYEKYGIEYSKEMISNLINEYRGCSPQIQFYNDVLPCLSDLRKAGIKTGIITDGYAIGQRQKLRAVEAEKYFDEIIVTDELGRDYWKPHPLAFELMREKFEVSYDEMVYVGDNPEKDFYIGSIYPIKTVRIIRPEGIHIDVPYFKNYKEEYLIYNLDCLLKSILKK